MMNFGAECAKRKFLPGWFVRSVQWPGKSQGNTGAQHAMATTMVFEGWGAKIIDRLSDDLTKAFPEMRGFRARNLKYMRAFAEAYPDKEFVQQVVAQLPWGHQVRILDSVKDSKQREWYIRQAVQSGWSRSVLVHQIESKLFDRQEHALTNFDRT